MNLLSPSTTIIKSQMSSSFSHVTINHITPTWPITFATKYLFEHSTITPTTSILTCGNLKIHTNLCDPSISPHPEPWVSEIGVTVPSLNPIISSLRSRNISHTVVPGSEYVSGVKLPAYGSVCLSFNTLPPSSTPDGNARAFDHIVGNVPDLSASSNHLRNVWPSDVLGPLTDFASFTAEDVGTKDSGLNSVVWRPEPEGGDSGVLLPLNEPVDGKTQSQITTYLKHNKGPGVQVREGWRGAKCSDR